VILRIGCNKRDVSGWVSRLAQSEELLLVGSDVLFKNKNTWVTGVRNGCEVLGIRTA